MNAVDLISKKRDGEELSTEEIRFFVNGVTSEIVPDYQAAAWLMAVFLRGMSRRETLDLTMAMRDSGDRIDLSDLGNGPALDKHSTGGVGDKTSLVVVPILAAAGVPILKMSGRGLGFSGGTIDKLESIPGFRTDLAIDRAKEIVKRVGAVMIAQSSQLAPADKILYSLRDVTATIESIPLIAASIMSKKLAAGGRRILLDVKCGQGAFMKTRERANLLAEELVAIGSGAGVPTVAVLTAMDEPLGSAVGNALEVREAIETMQSRTMQSRAETQRRREDNALETGEAIETMQSHAKKRRSEEAQPQPRDNSLTQKRKERKEMQSHAKTRRREEDNVLEAGEAVDALSPSPRLPVSPSPRLPVSPSSSTLYPLPSTLILDLCLQLAAHGLVAVGKAKRLEQGRKIASDLIANGAALTKFVEVVSAQGGPENADEILASLPSAAETLAVTAGAGGFVAAVDAEAIGRLATEMGAGRLKKGDQIDHSVGIVLHCKTGSPVLPSMPLATLHLRKQNVGRADEFAERLRAAYTISETAMPVVDSLVLGVRR